VSVCVLLSLHYEFQMSPKEQLPVNDNVDLVGTVFQVPIRKRDFKSYIFENVKMHSFL